MPDDSSDGLSLGESRVVSEAVPADNVHFTGRTRVSTTRSTPARFSPVDLRRACVSVAAGPSVAAAAGVHGVRSIKAIKVVNRRRAMNEEGPGVIRGSAGDVGGRLLGILREMRIMGSNPHRGPVAQGACHEFPQPRGQGIVLL